MGRRKTTGKSHNKTATTYTAQSKGKTIKHQQRNILESFRLSKSVEMSEGGSTTSPSLELENETNESINHKSNTDHEQKSDQDNDIDTHSSDTETETSDTSSNSDIELDNTNVNHNYLDEDERQAKWEGLFPNALYSVKQKGWLCTVCMEYGAGEYWRTITIKEWEHPKRTFVTHFNGKKHFAEAHKQVEIKTHILKKGGRLFKNGDEWKSAE